MHDFQDIPAYVPADSLLVPLIFGVIGVIGALIACFATMPLKAYRIKLEVGLIKPGFLKFLLNEPVGTICGVIISLGAGLVVTIIPASFNVSSAQAKAAEVAFHNISQVLEGEHVIRDFEFKYKETADSKGYVIDEATTEYKDLESNTKYDLTFNFPDGKTPTLMKTEHVNDEVISKLTK